MMLASSRSHFVLVTKKKGLICFAFFFFCNKISTSVLMGSVYHTQVRDEELEELENMMSNFCELPAAGGVENGYGKINILLQTYICRGEVDSFSLISDLSYVAQVRHRHRMRSVHLFSLSSKSNATVQGR